MKDDSILVIEDDFAVRAMLTEFLEDEGYDVMTAANGAEGLDQLEQSAPSLILLDVNMPVLDGWHFARILQERAVTVPIVVMTASRPDTQWDGQVEVAGFVEKPFDFINLLGVVERLLGVSSS